MKFDVKNASFWYKKDRKILSDISLSLQSGEILAILGPNGVGKTTFLKNAIGLLEWKNGGSFFDGKNIKNIGNIWQKISYVPQAKNSTFSFNVLEMIVLGLNSHLSRFKNPTKGDYDKAKYLLNELKMSHLQDKTCSQISGGEYQMVLIARALINEPNMLILDEPESNLDFKNQIIVLDIMKKLASQKNILIIFNTHYPEHALEISHHALMLQKGQKYIFGDSKKVINEENLHKIFDIDIAIRDVNINGSNKKVIKAYGSNI